MPDYQKMYHALFNDVTNVVSTLQQAQQKTEEMYVDSMEAQLISLQGGDKKETDMPDKNPTQHKKKPPSRDERQRSR